MNETPPPAAREAEERRKQREMIFVVSLVFGAVFALFPVMSPEPQGKWIASAMALAALAWFLAGARLYRAGSFRPSIPAANLLALELFCATGFLAIPLAQLPLGSGLMWRILAVLGLLLVIGLLAGLSRHDAQALAGNLRKRYRVTPGQVTIRKRPAEIWGMRSTSGSRVIDLLLTGVYGLYVALILLGSVLGGAAGLVLVRLIAPQLPPGSALGPHAMARIGLGAVVLPLIGYFLPPLWRMWRGLRAIETEARGPDGKLTVDWQG